MNRKKGVHYNTLVMKMCISEDGNIEAHVKEFKRFQRCQENTKHLFKQGDLIIGKSLEGRIGGENMSRNLEEKKKSDGTRR